MLLSPAATVTTCGNEGQKQAISRLVQRRLVSKTIAKTLTSLGAKRGIWLFHKRREKKKQSGPRNGELFE